MHKRPLNSQYPWQNLEFTYSAKDLMKGLGEERFNNPFGFDANTQIRVMSGRQV